MEWGRINVTGSEAYFATTRLYGMSALQLPRLVSHRSKVLRINSVAFQQTLKVDRTSSDTPVIYI
jgi:hypothetical protein